MRVIIAELDRQRLLCSALHYNEKIIQSKTRCRYVRHTSLASLALEAEIAVMGAFVVCAAVMFAVMLLGLHAGEITVFTCGAAQ